MNDPFFIKSTIFRHAYRPFNGGDFLSIGASGRRHIVYGSI